MVRCTKCKHCLEWTDEIGTLLLCELDYFCVESEDDLPCDFYVPLDVNNTEIISN